MHSDWIHGFSVKSRSVEPLLSCQFLSLSKEKSLLLLKIIMHGDHNNLNVELGFFISSEKGGME